MRERGRKGERGIRNGVRIILNCMEREVGMKEKKGEEEKKRDRR